MIGFAECIGSDRDPNEPATILLRIRTDAMRPDTATVIAISLVNAMVLRRELADFLAANNVSAR